MEYALLKLLFDQMSKHGKALEAPIHRDNEYRKALLEFTTACAKLMRFF